MATISKKKEKELNERDKIEITRENAIYVRVNAKSPTSEALTKLDVLREFCLRNGLTVKYEFYDKSSSFVLNKTSRMGLFKLMDLVMFKRIDTIYAYSTDNISPIGAPLIIHMCNMFGSRIVFVAENSQIASEKSEIYRELAYFSAKMLSKYGEQSKK